MSLETFISDLQSLDPDTLCGRKWETSDGCRCPILQLAVKNDKSIHDYDGWHTMKSVADCYGITRNEISEFINIFDSVWRVQEGAPKSTVLQLSIRKFKEQYA